ncbi:hypothetical protein J6590_047707 [Homalodisca vitripennis]|nr:hypothetical protein J6590_047707 [Homalodisca vitripennis]
MRKPSQGRTETSSQVIHQEDKQLSVQLTSALPSPYPPPHHSPPPDRSRSVCETIEQDTTTAVLTTICLVLTPRKHPLSTTAADRPQQSLAVYSHRTMGPGHNNSITIVLTHMNRLLSITWHRYTSLAIDLQDNGNNAILSVPSLLS